MAIPERETYYISRVEAILENILGADNVILPPESLIEELLQCWLYGDPFTETVVTDARNVKALLAIVNGETYDEDPTSEIEALLKAIANGEDPDPAFLPPKSRNGKLLLEIFNNRLPDEFQRCEWIESDGNQYINSGIKGTQDFGFEIEFIPYNATSLSGYGTIFASRYSSGNDQLTLSTYSPSGNRGIIGYGGSRYNAHLTRNKINIASVKNKVYYAPDGSETDLSAGGEFETPEPITIFALNQRGTISQYGTLRLYKYRMFNAYKKTRDFITCYRKADDEIGLYDAVGKIFYTNEGTGSFTKGPDVN